MNVLNTIGLDCFWNNKDNFTFLTNWVMEHKTVIHGYSGQYYYAAMGDAVFILNMKNARTISNLSTHVISDNVWKMVISDGIPLDDGTNDTLAKSLYFYSKDVDRELLCKHIPIRLINSDVLPSFTASEEVYMQVAAFPLEIHYCKDEQTCIQQHGIRFMGELTGVYGNITQWTEEMPCIIEASVKSVKKLRTRNINGELVYFYCVTVETCFGDIGIYHKEEMVDEQERGFLKTGAGVFAYCVVQGNVATGAYRQGAVYDELNALKLLQNCYNTFDFARCKAIFKANLRYIENGTEQCFKRKPMIAFLEDSVDSLLDKRQVFCTYLGKVTAYYGDDPAGSKLLDKDVLILAVGANKCFQSMLYITTDENGKVNQLAMTDIKDYGVSIKEDKHYQADEYVYLNLLKEAVDSGDFARLVNYCQHDVEYVDGKTHLKSAYAVLAYLQSMMPYTFEAQSVYNKFIRNLHRRDRNYIVQIKGQTIQDGSVASFGRGKLALALSHGSIQEADCLLLLELLDDKIAAIRCVANNGYILKALEPMKDICINDEYEPMDVLRTAEQWAVFLQKWFAGTNATDEQNFLVALADDCKMTITKGNSLPDAATVVIIANSKNVLAKLRELKNVAGVCQKIDNATLLYTAFDVTIVMRKGGEIAEFQAQLHEELPELLK